MSKYYVFLTLLTTSIYILFILLPFSPHKFKWVYIASGLLCLLPPEHMNVAASCQHLWQIFRITKCCCLEQVILWKTSRSSPKLTSRAPTLALSTMEAVQSYVCSMGHILYVLVHMAKSQLLVPVKVRGTLVTSFFDHTS